MFFVLSGYWISRMWDEKYSQLDSPYQAFVISRWWRLAPLFVIVQLIGYLYSVIGSGDAGSTVDLPLGWWITQPLVLGSTQFGRLLPPSWSLDVEMQFYLVAPLMLIGLKLILRGAANESSLAPEHRDLGAGVVFRSWDGKIILSLLLGWSLLLTASGERVESPRLDLYAWLFAVGAVVHFYRWNPGVRLQWFSLVSLMVVVATTILIPSTRELVWRSGSAAPSVSPWAVSLYSVALALLGIPLAASTVFRKSSSWDRWLGDLSYPLYLFHWIPRQWYYSQVDWSAPVSKNLFFLLTNFAIAGLGAVILLQLIDRPCQRIRIRWLGR